MEKEQEVSTPLSYRGFKACEVYYPTAVRGFVSLGQQRVPPAVGCARSSPAALPRWPCLRSLTSKSPHAIGTARPLCRRAPTAARGSHGHPRRGRDNGAVTSQRSPCATLCTGSPGETCPRLRALTRRRPWSSSARWGWRGVAGRPCNTARRGWAYARTIGCQGGQS